MKDNQLFESQGRRVSWRAMLVLGGLLLAAPVFAAQQGAYMPMGSGGNPYGGPIYHGAPYLRDTVALVVAGGGPRHFSLVTALVHMLGRPTVNAEVAKLTRQYGKRRVGEWVNGIDFAVHDALRLVAKDHIRLPAPTPLKGVALAKVLVRLGTTPNGTFWAGFLFDHLLSHGIHMQVMRDTDARYGKPFDANYHALTNQAFYDVAHALGDRRVRLASFH